MSVAALNIDPKDFAAWQAQQSAAPAATSNGLNIDPNDFNQWLQQQNPNNQGISGALKAFGGGVVQGIDQTAAGVNQLALEGLSKIPGLSSLNPNNQPTNALSAAFNPRNLSQPLSFTAAAQANTPIASGLGKFTGQVAATSPIGFANPLGAIADALSDAGIGVNALSKLPQFAQKVASALPTAGDMALQGGTASTVLGATNPNTSNASNFATGAILSPLIGGAVTNIPGAVQGTKNALLKMLGGRNTAQDALNTIAQGAQNNIDVPLSAAINSPKLQKMQAGIFSGVPLSGQKNAINNYVNQVQGQTKNILQGMLGNNNQEDIPTIIQGALQKAQQNARTQSNQLFDQTNQIAAANGIKIQPNNYFNTAQQIQNDLNSGVTNNPELAALNDTAQNQLQNFVSKITNEPKDFENATKTLRPQLNAQIQKAYMQGDNNLASNYIQLKNAFDSDLDNSALNSGVPELSNAYSNAVQNYKNNVAPFLEGDIGKYLKPGADPDTIIQAFVKTGQFDRPTQLQKITSQLPQDATSLLGLGHLLRGSQKATIDEAEPGVVVNNYNKLGQQSKNLLFTPEQNQQLTNLSNLYGQSAGLLKSNDVHGQLMGLGAEGLGALAAILHPGVWPTALAGMAAAPLGIKALNSTALRNSLLNPVNDFTPTVRNALSGIVAGGVGSANS